MSLPHCLPLVSRGLVNARAGGRLLSGRRHELPWPCAVPPVPESQGSSPSSPTCHHSPSSSRTSSGEPLLLGEEERGDPVWAILLRPELQATVCTKTVHSQSCLPLIIISIVNSSRACTVRTFLTCSASQGILHLNALPLPRL